MRLLVILSNHNSFAILSLCKRAQNQDPNIQVIAVCSAAFKNRMAEKIIQSGVECRVLDWDRNPHSNEIVASLRRLENSSQSSNRSDASIFLRLKTLIFKSLATSSVFLLLRERRTFKRFQKCKVAATRFVDEVRPSAILAMTDRDYEYVSGSLLWAAKNRKIKVVLPYVAQFDKDVALQYRRDANHRIFPDMDATRHMSLYKILTVLRHRSQIFKGAFFHPVHLVNAASKAGIASPDPWWTGNGICNTVHVDTQYTQSQYILHGVDKSRIKIVGHADFDKVYQSYQNRKSVRQELCLKYALNPSLPLVIFSVPQFAEQGLLDWDTHFKEIRAMLTAMSGSRYNLIASLHPRSESAHYRFISENFNIPVVEEQLADIIGGADIFVASTSTTLTWSVLCGIKTVCTWGPSRYLYEHLETIQRVQSPDDLTIIFAQPFLPLLTSEFAKDWEVLGRTTIFNGHTTRLFLQNLI